MEKEQELEWAEAQKAMISIDLVGAAKQQLKFLAAVDRNRWLYEGPALERAIYRYNVCWLPLLAKYSEAQIIDEPLVVPLDCEWVWHCHRLNPVRYKSDCEEFYERILDNHNVVSSIQGTSKRETEQTWNVPQWWYLILLIGSIVLSLVMSIVWKEDVQLPWWEMLFAFALAFIVTLPIGVIQATTDQQPGYDIIAQFIFGYILPGKPIASLIFKIYGRISTVHALSFLSDLKLGHYMKIPPRCMYTAQEIW